MRCTPVFILAAFVACAATSPAKGRKTCTVKASGTNQTDDAPAIRSAFKECGRYGRVVFQPATYYINSVLNISDLEDVDIDVQGKLLVRHMNTEPLNARSTNRLHSGALTLPIGSIILYLLATKTSPPPSFWAAIMSD